MDARLPHRRGLDPHASQYQSRGAAMFAELTPEKHREVVDRTLQLIKEAGI